MQTRTATDAIPTDSPRPALLECLAEVLDLTCLEADPLAIWWTSLRALQVLVLVAWGKGSDGLMERFKDARAMLGDPGQAQTYQGWVKALGRQGAHLVEALEHSLRRRLTGIPGAWPWPVVAVDGSRFDLPRTPAHRRTFGCAGKPGSAPQLFLSVAYHLASGLPWCWQIGPGTASERAHLRDMLERLPPAAMVLLDAGYVGYEALRDLLASGRHVLIRVGSGTRLIRRLCFGQRQGSDTVYLWPLRQQNHRGKPLALRLIVLDLSHGQKMYLLTDILDQRELSPERAGRLYRLRWGVETTYRTAKQTLEARKLRARNPELARMELAALVAGLGLLGLIQRRAISQRHQEPARASVAAGLKVVRRVIRPRYADADPQGSWWSDLGLALRDTYSRRRDLRPRPPGKKKYEGPPKPPQLLDATPAQVLLARSLQ